MTKPKTLAQGAEAKIILNSSREGGREAFITKDRIKKSYRIPELDKRIRKRRTKAEAKLLKKASKIINTPVPLISSSPSGGRVGPQIQHTIKMPYIKGKKLSEHLDKFLIEKQKQICKIIGEEMAKLHNENIIHGDLTTSNMILVKDKIFFIDFGLGYFNGKYEDKAVDLHLLKQALEAKHYKNWEALWKSVEIGYKKSKDAKIVLERLKAVERRGRYKH